MQLKIAISKTKYTRGFSRLAGILLAVFVLLGLSSAARSHHWSKDDWEKSGRDVIKYKHMDGDVIFFLNQNSGKYLTQNEFGQNDANRGTSVARDAHKWQLDAGFAWYLKPAGGKYWYIINLASGLYLTWDGNDSGVSVWGHANWERQKWEFINGLHGVMIVNKQNGEGLTQSNFGRDAGVNSVEVWPGQNDANGGWSWIPQRSKNYSLDDLRVLTIESVKAIKTSTGQDEGTELLFAGIDLAVELAAGAATGGSSVAATTSLKVGKTITRAAIKKAARDYAKGKAKDYAKDKALEIAQDQAEESGDNTASAVLDAGVDVLDAMSSEYIFNKIYGESPDDLDIQVNGVSIWPNGGRDDGRKIKSQQTHRVDKEVIFWASKGARIELVEYDYGSNDDSLGGIHMTTPEGDRMKVGTQRFENVLITHEKEGQRLRNHIPDRGDPAFRRALGAVSPGCAGEDGQGETGARRRSEHGSC